MRVFFDTNVIASAYATPGTCRRLFRLCLERHTVLISTYVLDELERILTTKFGVPEDDTSRILTSLKSSCTISNPKSQADRVSRDPKDDPVLAFSASESPDISAKSYYIDHSGCRRNYRFPGEGTDANARNFGVCFGLGTGGHSCPGNRGA